jgi:ATP-dependent DNA helicase RecG
MGTRQSGLPEFRLANLVRDQKILELAKGEANYLLTERINAAETARLIQQVRSQPRFGLANVG